jgi:hypothetical protein
VSWFFQPGFWRDKAPGFRLHWSGPPAYESRYCRTARRDAAIARARAPYPGRMSVGTSDAYRGRSRTTTYDSGRKIQVHATRERSRGRDGLRPSQRPVRPSR